jgi:hypothetical protein
MNTTLQSQFSKEFLRGESGEIIESSVLYLIRLTYLPAPRHFRKNGQLLAPKILNFGANSVILVNMRGDFTHLMGFTTPLNKRAQCPYGRWCGAPAVGDRLKQYQPQ